MDPLNASTRAFTGDRSSATAAVDNVLRRALRVSDPRDADEVAKALLARYSDEATRIRREQQGLPFSVMQAQAPVSLQQAGGVRPELAAAQTTLDTALTSLTTSPDLADVVPELRGWASTIRRAAADGTASARFAIDPGERDRAFGARRILSDYAKLARYAGAVSNCAQDAYCRVAQGCDSVGNVILVMMGDALGDAGLSRSGAVIQLPASVLQSRRDGVITALRNMLQPTLGDDQESWPRGPMAVYQIYDGLDAAGASDLRALLDEAYLARQLDDLIDMVAGSTPEALRSASSTAVITMQRLERFLLISQSIVGDDSPPAAMFFAELQLFVQGFDGGRTGYRLPYLSRSPLLVSAFAASQGIDQATRNLLDLALSRTALADYFDCLCGCSCDDSASRCLILAAKVLFDIDRAIDLYALGVATDAEYRILANQEIGTGDAEWRAAAYGAVVSKAADLFDKYELRKYLNQSVNSVLDHVATALRWPTIVQDGTGDRMKSRLGQLAEVFNMQVEDEKRAAALVASIAPLCRQDLLFQGRVTGEDLDPIGTLLGTARTAINEKFGNEFNVPAAAPMVGLPKPIATSLQSIADKKSRENRRLRS